MESMSKEQMKDKDISFQSLMDKNIEQIEKALNRKLKLHPDNDENMRKPFLKVILKIVK